MDKVKKLIINKDDLPRFEMLKGFDARFVHAENFTLVYWEIKAGLPFPVHQHAHEQASYILEGELEAIIDDKIEIIRAGDFWLIPPNSKHGGKALIDTKLLDIFYPVREDYKKLSEQ